MQSRSPLLDDFARVAAGAMSALSGVKGEVESRLREQLERVLAGMDLVSRDEFDAVKGMAAKARAEQEDLAVRVAALEARLGGVAGIEARAASTDEETPPQPTSPDAGQRDDPGH